MMKYSKYLLLFIGFAALFVSCKDRQEMIAEKFKSESDFGQFAPADAWNEDSTFAYYGSENEWNRRMFSDKAIGKFYKRQGQREMLEILDGDYTEAIDVCRKIMKKQPNDLESLFNLSVVFSVKNQPDSAVYYMNQALDNGLPFTRYLAGPRTLLKNLYTTKEFKALKKKKNIQIIHGPMKGDVTTNSAKIWLRTVDESKVDINIYPERDKSKSMKFSSATTRDKDYTCIVNIKNLNPDTEYLYDIYIDGNLESTGNHLKTFEESYLNKIVHLGIGGCAGYTPSNEKIWDTMAAYKFDAFLILGDNVYIDLPEMPGPFHNYTFYRRYSRPEYKRFQASTPIYSIWDDHDAATDDIWMGPYLDKPAWKMPMLKHFEHQWANPAYGTENVPGCFYNFSIGKEIEIFMLDCRFYRTNPFKEEKTMLGPDQKEWLKNSLVNSKAMIKIVVSSVPWAFDAKPGSRDTWAGFPGERKELFDFMTAENIDGVILISADRHRSDVRKIEREGDYPLYDFLSSRLTNIHTHELLPGSLIQYNEKCSFGEFTFDLSKDDPEIKFVIKSIDNEDKGEVDLRLSDLK